MASLTELPELLEEAAGRLRTSHIPHDETFEELSFAVELTLAALYRFNAEAQTREILRGPTVMRSLPVLTLVASRETPSRRGPSAKSRA